MTGIDTVVVIDTVNGQQRIRPVLSSITLLASCHGKVSYLFILYFSSILILILILSPFLFFFSISISFSLKIGHHYRGRTWIIGEDAPNPEAVH